MIDFKSIEDKIPSGVYFFLGLVALLIIISIVVSGMNWVGVEMSRGLYPVTYQYVEENITERMCANQCMIISDTGNIYGVSGNLFWNTVPGHRYRIEMAYNLSWVEASTTFGKTYPMITKIERL